jgi:hypothetical protein
MSILRDVIKQMNENVAAGAVGAGAVAAVPGGLFGGGSKKKMKLVRRIPVEDMQKTIENRNKMKWRVIGEMIEGGSNFDASDVISKLDAAEKKSKIDKDTTPFGLEDEEGNIVKVYVRTEQADEFESALASLLAAENEGEDDEQNSSMEIAEVLFQLKDKFDIVDVQWPEIEGDVEEEQEVTDPTDEDLEGDEDFGEEDFGEEDFGEEGVGEEDPDAEVEMEPAAGVESSLQQVIDMMKADAEARKAESEARAAEAQARAAEANASAAASKVKQEEQILDMETYDKQKKEEEGEAKRLAKLAKWKHQQAVDAETKLAQEEEESDCEQDSTSTITKDELMDKILHYLRSN